MNLVEAERAKYETVWAFEDYKKYSPGMENVARFLKIVQPEPREWIIDIGCGTGGAGLELEKAGLETHWLDITDAALDPAVKREKFIQKPIWGDWSFPRSHSISKSASIFSTGWHYGFCCDVLEHIPPEYVMLCLDRITENCGTSWLQVCNLPDNFGKLVGQPLHLTVQPFVWWRERLKEMGTLVEARDLCGTSLFVVER